MRDTPAEGDCRCIDEGIWDDQIDDKLNRAINIINHQKRIFGDLFGSMK